MTEGSDKVKYYTNAVSNTNVALEQARINTDTEAAAKKRAKNEYELAAIALGQKLSPAITVSIKAYTALLTILSNVITTFQSSAASAEDASDAFDRQLGSVMDLKTNLEPLLGRYDELIQKSNKSTDEQTELNSIIQTISETLPSAITQFDEYGKAISISTDRVREFISVETDRMKVVNQDAIQANQKALKKVEFELQQHQDKLRQIAEKGYFEYYQTVQMAGGGTSRQLQQSTTEEVNAVIKKNKELLSEQRGYNAEIERLNGDALTKGFEQREADRKSAQELEEKKQLYRKKTLKQLEKLAKDGDTLAAEMIATSDFTAAALGDDAAKLKTAYEKLSAEIAKYKAQLTNLVTSGDAVNSKIVGTQLQNLENQKKIIDKIIANGGDVNKFLETLSDSEADLLAEQAEMWAILNKDPEYIKSLEKYKDSLKEVQETELAISNSRVDKNIWDGEQKSPFDKDFYLDQISTAANASFF